MAQVASVTSIEMNSVLSEKPEIWIEDDSDSQRNPVVESAEFAYHVCLSILKTCFLSL
jgi:hypothetical protein